MEFYSPLSKNGQVHWYSKKAIEVEAALTNWDKYQKKRSKIITLKKGESILGRHPFYINGTPQNVIQKIISCKYTNIG